MKARLQFTLWARICGIAAALVVAFAAGAWTQNQPGQPILKWPLSAEAVHAAPNNHRVLFENDSVRLLEVNVQPGETEPVHWHMYPSVFAITGVQAASRDQTTDATTRRPRQFEDSDWSQPRCRTMPIEGPHQVTGEDSFPVHFYRLEFKRMDGKDIQENWGRYKR